MLLLSNRGNSIRFSYQSRFFISRNSLYLQWERKSAQKKSVGKKKRLTSLLFKVTSLQRIFSSSSSFVGNTFERFETFRDPEKFQEVKLITLRLASPDTIRRWAETRLPNGKVVGLVHNANTLHHNTLKPLKGGLFCERIFGPTKDFQCACGIQKEKNFSRTTSTRLFCLKCDVEYTWSLKRRYQSGYIRLVSPVAHLWYVKETPSFIAVMLDMKRKTLDSIIYCSSTLTIDSSMTQLKNNFMYSKTAINWAGVDIATQMQVKKSQQDLKESNNYSLLLSANNQKQNKAKSKTSNNVMDIPTFINEAENFPFYKNLLWLKTNRKTTFLKKQNEIETSDSSFSCHCVKNIKPFKTKSFSYKKSVDLPIFLLDNTSLISEQKNWQNFWTIAYTIAKKQIQKQKTFSKQLDHFIGASLESASKEATSSLRSPISKIWNIAQNSSNFEQKELTKTKGDGTFFDLKFLTSKDFLLVFYAQKTSKLFKKLPKFSQKEKPAHKGKLRFPLRSYSAKKRKANAFLSLSRFALKLSETDTPFVKKREIAANKLLSLFNTMSPFLHRTQEAKKEPAKLHLSITTFPVFLYIVMYLFYHCYKFDKLEIVLLEKIVKTKERKGRNRRDVSLFSLPIFSSIRFFYSFLRKQNILMSSLILKLKDIIKYWLIFKNFIFFQNILIKNNYFLKTIANLNEFNSVLYENKLDSSSAFPGKDSFSVRKTMAKSQTKSLNLKYFGKFTRFFKSFLLKNRKIFEPGVSPALLKNLTIFEPAKRIEITKLREVKSKAFLFEKERRNKKEKE